MASGIPSCTMFTSVPQDTFFKDTVVCISPGRFGSWTFAPQRPGRPGIMKEISLLIVRMATDNPAWGYSRIQGALKNLDHRVARSTVAKVLKDNGIPPAPGRPSSWRTFLRAH